jgi:GDPmannose 4,6-dehydratase
LGWTPQNSIEDIVQDMMECDLKLFKRDRLLMRNGHDVLKNDVHV